jgi:GMP synthase-like glutamine amidotransferase
MTRPTVRRDRPRALVLSHVAVDGLGALEEWLPAAGLDLDVVQVYKDDPVPTRLPDGCDALIVMGGSPNVDEGHEWLAREMQLVRDCVQDGIPVMGVCLGAQVLAAACGGVVSRGAAGPEVGPGRIDLRPEAADDPLFAGMPSTVEAVQWHWYGVERLPPGAVWLGSSSAYPHQAFRMGDRAWGIQFHPETPPAQVDQWTDEDLGPIRAAGLDPEVVRAQSVALAGTMALTWRPFFSRFAALVASAS